MSIIRIRPLDASNEPIERDEYGDYPEPEDITDDRLPLVGVLVAPRATDPNMGSSEETHDHGRDGLVEGKRLFSRNANLDVRRGDIIEIDGETWNVEGEPAVWGSAGLTVSLERSEG